MDKKMTAAQEWKSHWTLVLAASVGFSFFSVMLSTTGLFMEPVTQEFGWGRAEYALGVSIATIMTAVLSPFFGVLIDRLGSRRLVLPGVLLTMASIAAFGFTNGAIWQWVLLWSVFGVIAVSIKSTAWTAAVLGVFTGSKGLALGLTMAGTAVAQIAVPILGNWLIEGAGWRAAYVWLGLGWGGVTFVLCLLFFFDIHDAAGRRAKAASAAAQPAPEPIALTGLTVRQASRDWALWRVGISNFVVMLLTQGLAAHLFVVLTDAGVTRADAALLTSLGGVAAIVGKLITGYLLDRYRPNWIGGVTLGVAALAFLLLMEGVRSPTLIVIAMVINGYAAGTKTQITGYLTASYGGMKSFGAVYGTMAALMALAAGLGPFIAGKVFDIAGTYSLFLIAGAIGCVLGGIMIISLPGYPKWETREEGEPAAA